MARTAKSFNYNDPFPSRLRELIDNSSHTQESVARACNVTRQTVGFWCSGSTVPDAKGLAAIARLFNVTTDFLLGISECSTVDNSIRAVCDFTGLAQNAVEELHMIYLKNLYTGYTDILSALIEHPDFNYLLALIDGKMNYATKTETVDVGYARMSKEAVVNGELSRMLPKMVDDIKPRCAVSGAELDKRENYRTLFGLYRGTQITEAQFEDCFAKLNAGEFSAQQFDDYVVSLVKDNRKRSDCNSQNTSGGVNDGTESDNT